MIIITETERLILRQIEFSDEDGLYELDSDPEVHRYLGNNPISSKEEAGKVIGMIRQQYTDNGVARWAVIEKAGNKFIGWAGLKLYKEELNGYKDFYEVGYRFIQKYWGQGYATEAAKASIKYGFETLGPEEIFAMADAKNMTSRNVLEKCGMEYTGEFMLDETPHSWYKIKNPGKTNVPDFIAELKFKTTEEGGRSSFALSGYGPQVKFPFSERQTGGKQIFLNKDKVYPGETVLASIKILSPQFFEKALSVGMEFEFREGHKISGTGKLIEILNPSLKK